MSYDEIVLLVKNEIATNAVIDEDADTVTMDCNGIDHIAEAVAEMICGEVDEAKLVLAKDCIAKALKLIEEIENG